MSAVKATACYCGTGSCSTCANTSLRAAVADPFEFRHGAIKARLLARIGAIQIDGRRPLAGLGTRDDDDPTIALLDAFAGALHVLAWNVARLSDDGSIRRTADRDALVDLTRMLGYEPRPALAATTTLTFTVDTFQGSATAATIPKGAKVSSVPGQDEMQQTFETDADLEARAEWNALRPVQQPTVPPVSATTTTVTISGTSTTARPGDRVLVYLEPQPAVGSWSYARVTAVTRDASLDPPRTRLDLASPVTLPAIASQRGDAYQNRVVILGQLASAFGASAPDLSLMSDPVRTSQLSKDSPATAALPTEWRGLTMPTGGTANGGVVDLDAVYPDAAGGRFVVFCRVGGGTNPRQLGRIESAVELSRKGFALAARVTRIDVTGIDLTAAGFLDEVRETAIYIETTRETLLVVDADLPLPAAPGDRVTVEGSVSLPVGRRVVLSGEPWTTAPGQGQRIAEVATLARSSPAAGGNTELVFERAITNRFRSTTLSLLSNAVGASHGESAASGAELLGSGKAASLSQRFGLKRSPLSYVPASDPRGYAPAIEVRVNDRLYDEVPTLFGLGSEDRAYTVRTGREGAEVQFAGRLPSGSLNVTARYRTGGGTSGNLTAGRLTTQMTPVLGVGGVCNPVPADGASDAETIDALRTAAPQSIRTLDRVVSLTDFEAFARTRRGVGKALATALQVGMRSVVCLTIATTELESPVAGSDIVESLRTALATVTVPGRSVRIEGFTDLTAQLTVALAIDPAFRRADVESSARVTLSNRFGRAARNFGEALHRSAVLAAFHEVEGVIAARLPVFVLPGGLSEADGRLRCPAPSIERRQAPGDAVVTDHFVRAGLLSIDAAQVQFAEMLP